MAEKKKGGYRIALFGMQATTHMLMYVLVAVIVLFVGRTSYHYGYELFNEQAVDEAPGVTVTIEIPEGSSVKAIGRILAKNGLIESANLFTVQERLSNYHGKLKAGTYRLNSSQKPTEIMAVIAGESAEVASTAESKAEDTSVG